MTLDDLLNGKVKILETDVQPSKKQKGALDIRTNWSAIGTVVHWGDIDTRKNIYDGILTLAVIYSKRMRGDPNKQALAEKESNCTDNEIEIIDVSDFKPRNIPPPKWLECIKKIWEIDPLQCPHCKAEMKIISFINEPPVIRR